MDITVIATPELGDRSYVISEGSTAFIVDPQRDIDRIITTCADRGLVIAAVGDTHMHNDYVSGGFALASELGVPYLVHADDPVAFERVPVRDGDVFEFGPLTVSILHTPGHTPTHISFRITSIEDPVGAVMSGGSMLYGSVGRTDLISADMTEPLTHAQYQSVHRLADDLPGATQLMPTHGFGSFCSAVSVQEVSDGTVGGERRVNIVFQYPSEDDFVAMLMASYDPYPAYYRHMGPANLAGASALRPKTPPVLTGAEAAKLREEGALAVDIRARRDHFDSHPDGARLMEYGSLFSTYLGWTIPSDSKIILVTDDSSDPLAAVTSLGFIGIEHILGQVDAKELSAVVGERSIPAVDFAEYFDTIVSTPHQLLDVRNPSEHRQSRLPGAKQIPIYEVADRLHEIDMTTPVVVHCAAGYRASAAGSMLAARGFEVVVIDDDLANGLSQI
ncbi:rhodanese-like domain-containing protein [Ferrimicrobium sp.]|uniref:MBL fold metallo-hydrolase n=1 Tax=Ferrimicrobium sp. TaxID=2926050 RepID=UPI00262B95C5|nr:rhodanese-like domain-containing protein [Ferrimicrobium sp.]